MTRNDSQMKQLTIRGFDPELVHKIRELAEDAGLSLNQAAIRLLRKGAGLDDSNKEEGMVGNSLDHLIGSWTDDQARAIQEAVSDFEKVDDDLWK